MSSDEDEDEDERGGSRKSKSRRGKRGGSKNQKHLAAPLLDALRKKSGNSNGEDGGRGGGRSGRDEFELTVSLADFIEVLSGSSGAGGSDAGDDDDDRKGRRGSRETQAAASGLRLPFSAGEAEALGSHPAVVPSFITRGKRKARLQRQQVDVHVLISFALGRVATYVYSSKDMEDMAGSLADSEQSGPLAKKAAQKDLRKGLAKYSKAGKVRSRDTGRASLKISRRAALHALSGLAQGGGRFSRSSSKTAAGPLTVDDALSVLEHLDPEKSDSLDPNKVLDLFQLGRSFQLGTDDAVGDDLDSDDGEDAVGGRAGGRGSDDDDVDARGEDERVRTSDSEDDARGAGGRGGSGMGAYAQYSLVQRILLSGTESPSKRLGSWTANVDAVADRLHDAMKQSQEEDKGGRRGGAGRRGDESDSIREDQFWDILKHEGGVNQGKKERWATKASLDLDLLPFLFAPVGSEEEGDADRSQKSKSSRDGSDEEGGEGREGRNGGSCVRVDFPAFIRFVASLPESFIDPDSDDADNTLRDTIGSVREALGRYIARERSAGKGSSKKGSSKKGSKKSKAGSRGGEDGGEGEGADMIFVRLCAKAFTPWKKLPAVVEAKGLEKALGGATTATIKEAEAGLQSLCTALGVKKIKRTVAGDLARHIGGSNGGSDAKVSIENVCEYLAPAPLFDDDEAGDAAWHAVNELVHRVRCAVRTVGMRGKRRGDFEETAVRMIGYALTAAAQDEEKMRDKGGRGGKAKKKDKGGKKGRGQSSNDPTALSAIAFGAVLREAGVPLNAVEAWHLSWFYRTSAGVDGDDSDLSSSSSSSSSVAVDIVRFMDDMTMGGGRDTGDGGGVWDIPGGNTSGGRVRKGGRKGRGKGKGGRGGSEEDDRSGSDEETKRGSDDDGDVRSRRKGKGGGEDDEDEDEDEDEDDAPEMEEDEEDRWWQNVVSCMAYGEHVGQEALVEMFEKEATLDSSQCLDAKEAFALVWDLVEEGAALAKKAQKKASKSKKSKGMFGALNTGQAKVVIKGIVESFADDEDHHALRISVIDLIQFSHGDTTATAAKKGGKAANGKGKGKGKSSPTSRGGDDSDGSSGDNSGGDTFRSDEEDGGEGSDGSGDGESDDLYSGDSGEDDSEDDGRSRKGGRSNAVRQKTRAAHQKRVTRNLRRVFDKLDTDKSGMVSAAEMGTALRSMGHDPSTDEIEVLLRSADRDGDGSVSFGEFKHMMQKRLKRDRQVRAANTRREMYTQFHEMSALQNTAHGLHSIEVAITVSQFKFMLTDRLGLQFTDAEMNALVKLADKDGNKEVSVEEFMLLCELMSYAAEANEKIDAAKSSRRSRPKLGSTEKRAKKLMADMPPAARSAFHKIWHGPPENPDDFLNKFMVLPQNFRPSVRGRREEERNT